MVAIPVLLLVQAPPAAASVNGVALPAQRAVAPMICPGNKARLPKLVKPDVIPAMPVTPEAVIVPGTEVDVNGCTVKPKIVISSGLEVPPLVIFTVNAVVVNPPLATSVISPPPAAFKVGGVPVQNCHPAGGVNTNWSEPLAKSAILVSVIVMVPRVVHGGVGPQMADPPEAGVTVTCAKLQRLRQQKRVSRRYTFFIITFITVRLNK